LLRGVNSRCAGLRARRGPSVQVCRSGLRRERGLGFASVAVERERVDREREAEEVEVLAGVADAVGAAEPYGVVEVATRLAGVAELHDPESAALGEEVQGLRLPSASAMALSSTWRSKSHPVTMWPQMTRRYAQNVDRGARVTGDMASRRPEIHPK
jgi:hypothetical protein